MCGAFAVEAEVTPFAGALPDAGLAFPGETLDDELNRRIEEPP